MSIHCLQSRTFLRLIFFLKRGPIAQFRSERTPDKREVVGSIPTRPTTISGGVAQLEERLLCTQEVIGSTPFTSTIKALSYKL